MWSIQKKRTATAILFLHYLVEVTGLEPIANSLELPILRYFVLSVSHFVSYISVK